MPQRKAKFFFILFKVRKKIVVMFLNLRLAAQVTDY